MLYNKDMNLEKYLSSIFNTNIITTKTTLGLTNDIYFCEANNNKYIVNVPKKDVKALIRAQEYPKILALINKTGLDVEEVFYDDKTGIRITKYLDIETYGQCTKTNKHLMAIKKLKEFHRQEFKIGVEFNPYQKYLSFKNKITKQLINYQDYDDIWLLYHSINNKHILCHNDLVDGNILFDEDRCYLIDWEYAKDNDPLFDLMSFITENNINNPLIREEIYQNYFDGEIDQELRRQILVFENVHNLLWAAWSNMMYDLRHKDIYLKIFNDKIEMLQRSYNQL